MATESKQKEKKAVLLTPAGRVSFAYVYEKSDMSDKFEVTLIWPEGTDLSVLEAEVDRVANEYFKGKIPKNFKHPIRDCEEKEDKEGYDQGGRFARFWRATKPRVVYKKKAEDGTLVDIPEDSGDFYSGCWGIVSFNCFGYDTNGNKGVSFGLQNVIKIKDDTSFSGTRSDAEDDFADIDDLEDALS